MRWVIRLYPRAWRERYGDEVLELLAASRRPFRDGVNVAVRALAMRASGQRRRRLLPALLIVAGTLGLLWAGPHLQDGILEVPGHWWSTLGVLPLPVGALWLAWSSLPPQGRRPAA